MNDQNCIFCKIVRKEIPTDTVWEDDNFIAFMDLMPINPGHVLVVPKVHTDYIFDMDNQSYLELFLASKNLAPHIQKVTNAKRVGIAVEGFGVPHCHVHLVPLHRAQELNPERAKKADGKDLLNIAEKIRAELI